MMKQISLLFSVALMISCSTEEMPVRKFDFVVADKIALQNEEGMTDYYLKSKDTIVQCGTEDFATYDIGDTLKLEMPKEGFFKGTVFKQ